MGVWSQPHDPAASTPGKYPLPIVQETGWDPGPVWTGEENLVPTGIRSQTVQPVVSRYTDWAIRAIRDKVKGLIMKPMMVYRATAFTNHGQINICCLSVTSLMKAWVTETIYLNWFPNYFYGTWRNNSNRRPRNSLVLFFDKELLSGHEVRCHPTQSLPPFNRLIGCAVYLQSTSLIGQHSQAINMNHNFSAKTETLLRGHRLYPTQNHRFTTRHLAGKFCGMKQWTSGLNFIFGPRNTWRWWRLFLKWGEALWWLDTRTMGDLLYCRTVKIGAYV
jgi:hypothetical protein